MKSFHNITFSGHFGFIVGNILELSKGNKLFCEVTIFELNAGEYNW